MKFYDSAGPNPKVVRVFMAEKGITIPLEKVDLRAGDNRKEPHLKRNPHGQMPALELDNGSFVSEITAICEYLEDKHPTPAADRRDAGGEGRVPDVDASRRPQHLRAARQRLPLRRGQRFLQEPHSDRARSSPGLKAVAQNRLKWLDGQMADGREFLCGKRFTLADILLYCFVTFFAKVGQPVDPANKNVGAWLERVGARPSMNA